jgi:hypothetical protein
MADGLFYVDMREPHLVTDIAAVTMAAGSAKAPTTVKEAVAV